MTGAGRREGEIILRGLKVKIVFSKRRGGLVQILWESVREDFKDFFGVMK